MKFFLLFALFFTIKNEIALIENSECDPRNIYITIYDDYSNIERPPSLRVGFNTKKKCQTSIVVKIEHNEEILVFNFELSNIYITKIFDDIKAQNYIRYVYLSEPLVFDHNDEFVYEIFSNYDIDPILLKTFNYKSKVINVRTLSKLRILTYGDQPLNDQTEKVVESILKEDFDLIILLGDFANMINDDYGQKGDDFFDALEPLITRVPVLITPGNKDMSDNGSLLNFRFRFGTNMIRKENNNYVINLKNISFIFFNLDYYYYMDFISKDKLRRWLIDKLDELDTILKPDFKVLVTHKPFRCLNKLVKEACHEEVDEKYSKIEEVISRYNFDLHLAGHINQYQRFKNDIFQTKFHTLKQFWDGASFTPTTIITGTGGLTESGTEFEGEFSKDISNLKIKIIENLVGYTILKLEYPLKQIEGEFIMVDKTSSKSLDDFIIPFKNDSSLQL